MNREQWGIAKRLLDAGHPTMDVAYCLVDHRNTLRCRICGGVTTSTVAIAAGHCIHCDTDHGQLKRWYAIEKAFERPFDPKLERLADRAEALKAARVRLAARAP